MEVFPGGSRWEEVRAAPSGRRDDPPATPSWSALAGGGGVGEVLVEALVVAADPCPVSQLRYPPL